MKIKSYSKINYTLEVGKKMNNGFHSLKSIVQTVDLCDFINIEKSEKGIILACSDLSVPSDERNTVYRACKLFLEKNSIKSGVNIYIEKNIPSQAGLGGGSGNASYTLLALNRLFETDMSLDELSCLSSRIGSDCPLFVYGGTVRMTGRGENIRKLPSFPKVYFIIIKPDFSVSTKEAYAKLDERDDVSFKGYSEKLAENSSYSDLIKYVYNDFEILNGEKIGKIKNDIMKAGADASLLCGSGSCVFGMFDSQAKRDKASAELSDSYTVYKAQSVFPD